MTEFNIESLIDSNLLSVVNICLFLLAHASLDNVCIYSRLSKIVLSNGIITEIELSGKNSPEIVRANSKVSIGMTKALAEEVLGTDPKKMNLFFLYNKYGSVAVNYRQNKIKNIVIYKW